MAATSTTTGRRARGCAWFAGTLAGCLAASNAYAESRVLIEWNETWQMDMSPGFTATATIRVGPLQVVLDENGVGVSQPVVPQLTSNVILGPALSNPQARCRLGTISNAPVRVKVERWNESQVDVQFERLGDGSAACQELICPTLPGDSDAPSCIAIGYAVVQFIYDPRALTPGVPLLAHSTREDTAVFRARDQVHVTLNPCAPQRGNSGDGTVRFESVPPVGVARWPVIENHDLRRGDMSARVGTATGRPGTRSGYTFASFRDSVGASDPGNAGARTARPKTEDVFGSIPSGGGVCGFLDGLSLEFPQIEVWIPVEYWEARHERCWYAAIRHHESRHALLFEDAFRAMQTRLRDLVGDVTLPSPARARYFPSEGEFQRYQAEFRARVDAILLEEVRNLEANNDAMDEDEQYRFEEGICRMPEAL